MIDLSFLRACISIRQLNDRLSGVLAMSRRVWQGILGLVAGVFLSPWIAFFIDALCGSFYRPEDRERPFAVIGITCAIVCGLAGLGVGLGRGGDRLKGRSKSQAYGALMGAITGVPCGIVLAALGGVAKFAIVTVLGCVLLGILAGTMMREMGPPVPQAMPGREEYGAPRGEP
jgi:hypothetical protein